MENRNGLVVAAEASQSAANAERELALDLLDRVLNTAQPGEPEQEITVGGETQSQKERFIEDLQRAK